MSELNLDKMKRLYSNRSILMKISPTKEEIKRAFLEKGVGPYTSLKEFSNMNFKIKDKEFSAQTLLRGFGDGSRSSKNFSNILSWIGINSKYKTNTYDYSDPKVIKAILLSSKINLQEITFKDFISKKIITDKFIGTGRELVMKFQNSILKKAEDKKDFVPEIEEYIKSLRSMKKKPIPLRSSFETMLKLAEIRSKIYDRIKYNPRLLREILDSANIDFNNWFISISEFYRLRFNSEKLRLQDKRNKGIITGQALAKRYFGTTALRNIHIFELLKTAGYKPKFLKNKKDIKNPKILREIIKSCKQNVDFSKIRLNDFLKLEFESPYFIGKGHSILKEFGKINYNTLREVIRLSGISKRY